MTPSVSLSLFDAPEKAPVLFSDNIEKNIPHIAELGYRGVDLFVENPSAEVSIKAPALLEAYGLEVGVVMPAALAGKGLYFGDEDPSVRDQIVKESLPIIEYAAELGAMVSLGLVRGSMGKEDTPEKFMGRFSDSILRILPRAQELGVDLLIEPINRYEINTLNGSNEAYDFIEESGLPLYLMLDTFHMNIEDVSIDESFRYCRERVRHVHFLDSNRLAPGMGHLDMIGILKTLHEIGYTGHLCLEALPKPDFETCAQKGAEFFRKAAAAGVLGNKKRS